MPRTRLGSDLASFWYILTIEALKRRRLDLMAGLERARERRGTGRFTCVSNPPALQLVELAFVNSRTDI